MRRHPYILATLIATLLSLVVWFCVPKEYAAMTKVSDEYKEMDVAIGINMIQSKIREQMGLDNEGINSTSVYCKLLETSDFAEYISHVLLAEKKMTYGEWIMQDNLNRLLHGNDTVTAVSNQIDYNVSYKHETLKIKFCDRDPEVASYMLDCVTRHLQDIVTKVRRASNADLLKNAQRARQQAWTEYQSAARKYAIFNDSHIDSKSEKDKTMLQTLADDAKIAQEHYQEVSEKCARYSALMIRNTCAFAVIKSNSVPTDNTSHLFGYLFCFVSLAIIAVKGYRLYQNRKKDSTPIDFGGFTSPWSITIVVWAMILLMLAFRDESLLNAPKQQFYISLAIWVPLLCITAFLVYNLMPGIPSEKAVAKLSSSIELNTVNRYAFNFLMFISIIITPLYVKKILDVVLMFGTKDFMMNVRDFAVYGDAQMGFLNYSVVINYTLLLVALWAYPRISKLQLAWAIIALMLNTLAIMEKGGFALIFFCTMFVLFEKKVVKISTIVISAALLVALFFGFNLLRAEEGSDYQKNETIFGFIAMYILSPPVAYCELHTDITNTFGGRTLFIPYTFLSRWGILSYEPIDRLQEFVHVPVATNVYTIFQPYYQDYGQIGIAVFAVIYGIITGYLYRKMRNGDGFERCVYMYFGYILVLQFFQENLFTVGLHVPQIAFFTYLCTQKRFKFTLGKQSA